MRSSRKNGVSRAPALAVAEWHLDGQGIGTELVRRLFHKLNGLYMADVMCDLGIQPFYARLGMLPSTGMMIRELA